MDRPRNGAQTVIECLKREGVEYVFGYPGGANIPIMDAIVDSGLEYILTRHEQGASHIADGYARVSGKPGVVLVTSGPGATNTITGIMTAHMDSVPLVVLCGQTIRPMLGLDAFQEADVFGISMPIVKHSYLVKDANDIPRIMREAFHIASTGRPGPVLIDIPKDVSTSPCTTSFSDSTDLPGYIIPQKLDASAIEKTATALNNAKKPILLLGHGCILSNAEKELYDLVTKAGIPVVNTLLGKGAFPETEDLSLGMLGMHGTAYANFAIKDCDLIFSLGSRWDDRIVGKVDEFCRDAVKIHADIDIAEHNKMVKPDIFIHGDIKAILQDLIPQVDHLKIDPWRKHTKSLKKKYPLTFKKQGGLKAQYVLQELQELTKGDAIITTDVGQHQMWSAQYNKTKIGRHWLSSGGAGTMGFGFPAAIGAQFAKPNDTVVAVVGDGGFQMTFFELSTIMINKLPVKILVIDNKYLGMVRQWQELFYDNNLSGVDLVGNPDFVKLAESYGVKGVRIKRNAEVKKKLKEALEHDGPCLIHAEVIKEDNVYPMIPSGATYDKMLISKPKQPLEKPKGST